MKTICVVTGSRAEYGLLRWVMDGIRNSNQLKLQLIVTGMHLSPDFGLTVKEIEADGFYIDKKIEMLLSSDTPVGISKSMGLGMIGFADALYELAPDLVLLLGDRFEVFSLAAAAMNARIPIAHLHGGEATEGLIDEAIRHSITKMSHLHFVAAEEYRQRVVQLGEQPNRVHTVGGLGLDNIARVKLLDRESLESAIGFKFKLKNLLITFHPVTLEEESRFAQRELLAALSELKNTGLIFTMSNADADGRGLHSELEDFCSKNKQAKLFSSLGHLKYLSCMQYVDGVVGNSSSGLIEAPAFKIGTVNIGDRQLGRLKASSVIDCVPTRCSILSAINSLFSNEFSKKLEGVVNPYGNGGASESIVRLLEEIPFQGLLKKRFYDLNSQ